MRRLIAPLALIMTLIGTALPVCAQVPAHLWSKRFGGTGFGDTGRAVAVDGSGNLFVAGSFSATTDFGGGGLVALGSNDIFVAKYDPIGNHLWSKRLGASSGENCYSVAADVSGNVLVTGYFNATVDFGGGGLVSAGSADIFVAKYSASGTHLWSKRFGSTLADVGLAVTADGSDNVLVTGYFNNTVNFGGANLVSAGSSDIFLAKFDASGNHLWSKRFGGIGIEQGSSVTKDASGNVLLTGYFGNSVDFGGGALVSAGGDEVFLAKYDANGNHLWSKRFGGTFGDYGYSVAVGPAGAVYLAGAFNITIDLGGGPLVSAGGLDFYLAKYDANGVHQWSNRHGGVGTDAGYAMALDGSGNAFVTGVFGSTVDFGGGPLVSAGSDEIFMAKYAADGTHRWSARYGSSSFDLGYGAAVDGVGNACFTGTFNGSVDFGGGALTSAGNDDLFLAKYAGAAAQPLVTSIIDIGNDQGRAGEDPVRTLGLRSIRVAVSPVTSYEAYRRDDAAPALVSAWREPAGLSGAGTARERLDVRGFRRRRTARPTYGIDAPTIGDSTIALGQYCSVFYVRAATADDDPLLRLGARQRLLARQPGARGAAELHVQRGASLVERVHREGLRLLHGVRLEHRLRSARRPWWITAWRRRWT